MKRGRWFLPDSPDVLGMLRRQVDLTIQGADAFAAWARGDAAGAEALRAAEREGDAVRREMLAALRAAFVTPLEPGDLFALSRGVDRILDSLRDLVSESDAMQAPPDARIAGMGDLLARALRHLDEAIALLGSDPDGATTAADEAITAERDLNRDYYAGMAELLELSDRTERIARRELYRRCAHVGEIVEDVAERVVYAVVKQS